MSLKSVKNFLPLSNFKHTASSHLLHSYISEVAPVPVDVTSSIYLCLENPTRMSAENLNSQGSKYSKVDKRE